MKRTLLVTISAAILLLDSRAADSLDEDFANPPETTKPRCYWYWMDGHITKEGITKDLEAMKHFGVGEGYIGVISGQSGKPANEGDPKALSEAWWSNIEHAIREGGRIGVDIGLFNSPGWSQSGGPWVKPSQAMRHVVLPETRLHGPQLFEGKLPMPPGQFQDIAVLAFPAPAGETVSATITAQTPTNIQFEMAAPFTVRSVTVRPAKPLNVTAELQSSDDGKQYQTVKQFTIDRHNPALAVGPVPFAPIVAAFPAKTARFFRLEFSAPCEPGEVQLSPAARVENYAEKSLQKMYQGPQPPFDFYNWPAQAEPETAALTINPKAVLDLSKKLTADGALHWDVPAGDWVVLRLAMTPTGTQNGPAPAEATGFEVDKMNRSALKSHFDAYMGELLRRMPAADRKAWKRVVADSYEQGPQNWTEGFAKDFQKRYAYDPMPWVPAMTGRIVRSAHESARFLWDLRRMVADRVAEDYVGGLTDLCHQHGMRMWLENYGHWGFPSEFLKYGSQCDEIGGEFWVEGSLGEVELRAAASAAHIYNKPVVWAEAFTGGPSFKNSPRSLKARGDWAFCEGINQFVLHVYIHQPWEDKIPGINAPWGSEFNRHNTWFEEGKAWVDYLRRCSVMLQTGLPVADVAYFIGEDTPKMAGKLNPPLPPGRDFDYINADVIENGLIMKNGSLTLPHGLSYRVLVLPELITMRPAILRTIRDLVKAGATVVGPAPSRSPSLEDFPHCDAEVQKLAREVWGDTARTASGKHGFGKGYVVWGKDLNEILLGLGSKPDFECSANLRFKHRRAGDTDIYFVANPKNEAVATTAAFRAGGRMPELWHPETGRIERLAVYEETDGIMHLPLALGPHGSVFVVFREKALTKASQVLSVTRDGKEILSSKVAPQNVATTSLYLTRSAAGEVTAQVSQPGQYELKFADGKTRKLKTAFVPAPVAVTGPWEVSFAPGWDAPQKVTFDQLTDWTKREENGIKYFSGHATYRTTFELSSSQIGNRSTRIMLDLGEVRDLATVRVNGRELTTLWLAPWQVDITPAVEPGRNALEITIVNTWNNRLVGDAALPAPERRTFTTTQSVTSSTPLLSAGLLGPVMIRSTVEVTPEPF